MKRRKAERCGTEVLPPPPPLYTDANRMHGRRKKPAYERIKGQSTTHTERDRGRDPPILIELEAGLDSLLVSIKKERGGTTIYIYMCV